MNCKIQSEMLAGARKQFCLDIGMDYEEYEKNPNKKAYIVKSKYKEGTTLPGTEGARIYAGSDAFFWATICMGQLFLCVDEQIYDWAVEEFSDCAPEWFCEYGNLRKIDEKLKEYGHKVGDTHVYFLPGEAEDGNAHDRQVTVGAVPSTQAATDECPNAAESDCHMPSAPCPGNFRWFEQEEILRFKEENRFDRALCFSPTQPDVLAVAAMRPVAEKTYDQSNMAGMAGVSEDGKYLWQIGINVDDDYRGKGLAADLVCMLKEEVIRRGKIPFYGTSESHIISQTVGLKAGFVPAFTSVYVKPLEQGCV